MLFWKSPNLFRKWRKFWNEQKSVVLWYAGKSDVGSNHAAIDGLKWVCKPGPKSKWVSHLLAKLKAELPEAATKHPAQTIRHTDV